MKHLAFGCVLIAAFLLAYASADPIYNLPGYNGPSLNMTSGYITVDANHGRRLFYWLIRSQGNPDTDPLVFWYQGGPGCSGLGGMLLEHGAFTPDSGTGVQYAPISWTSVANVVYLEQPAGVGFSYSNTPSDYNTNDLKAAEDNFLFIEGFLSTYPEYSGRKIWLTGESYAGVYIPTLTAQILDHPNSKSYKQLRGLMLGNPVFSCTSLDYNNAQFMLFYYHGLVSYSNYAAWIDAGCDKSSSSPGCNTILNNTINAIGVIDQQLRLSDNLPSLDPDDLYQDFCGGNGTLDFADINPNSCNPVGNRAQNYLNRGDVQKAIHAQPTTWTECTNSINYTSSGNSMIPYYRRVFNERPDVSVLVYSGDVDVATVPFGFTIACLNELRHQVTPMSTWQPWFVNGATAGYYESYREYTYGTIKGGGHEAPEYEPLIGFNLFSRFLTSQNLTSTETFRPRRQDPNLLTQGKILRALRQKGFRL